MYRLTKNPDEIYNTETCQTIPRGHRDWPEEWLIDHVPEPAAPPYLLYSPEHFRAIRDQAFAWMRGEAVARGYDGIESCASYYNSSVSRYRLEARAMVAWRDAVNQHLEQLVLAPPVGIETWDQVQALLPQPDAFDWPEKVELPLDMDEKAVLS